MNRRMKLAYHLLRATFAVTVVGAYAAVWVAETYPLGTKLLLTACFSGLLSVGISQAINQIKEK